ncbi:hypothetical protein JTB14_015952 [Gonioctena quinquepunctata]|nr:hypothetical protein JTB14_015952 [Gonioctena quinquepunctata]
MQMDGSIGPDEFWSDEFLRKPTLEDTDGSSSNVAFCLAVILASLDFMITMSKTTYNVWTEEDMSEATDKYQSETMGFNEACPSYKVPKLRLGTPK